MRLSILILMLCVAGCASMKSSSSLEVLFTYGTLRAIEQADQPAEKAARIQGYAREILALTDAESVRAEVLERLIQEAIASRDLSPADQYLVGQIVPLADFYAGEDGLIVGERKEALVAFLNDLIGATQLY